MNRRRIVKLEPKEALTQGNLHFALMLFKHLGKEDPHCNLLISPFAIRMGLSALLRGARGQTAAQLKEVTKLAFFSDLQEMPQALQAALATVPLGQTEVGHLHLANLLTVQDSTSVITPDFQDAATGCGLHVFSISEDINADREVINEMAESETAGVVAEILSADDLNEISSVVLASAYIYKGLWNIRFDPNETKLSWFYSHAGTQKHEVSMMRHRGRFRFGINERPAPCRILELPMGEGQLSTILVLPKEVDGLAKLESHFFPDLLRTLAFSLMETTVTVVLPVIKFHMSTSLAPLLKTMGATNMFDSDGADLGGISGSKGPFVTTVRHHATFEVQEGGLTDPPATVMSGLMMVEEYFVADHPFLFLLKDNQSDLIHMIGRYQVPP